MSRAALRLLRPLQSRAIRPKRLQLIQRRKLGSNWEWDNIDPKLRWTNTKLGRADPNTQMYLPLNNKYAIMAQLKFMLPVYLCGIGLWIYIDRTEPIWIDADLYTYIEKED